MSLCACGHPIKVLDYEKDDPPPEQCFCCRRKVRFGSSALTGSANIQPGCETTTSTTPPSEQRPRS